MPNTSDTSATPVTQMRQRVGHEWDRSDTSATRVLHEGHEFKTKIFLLVSLSKAKVKNFVFDNDTSKNIFSHPYIYYMANKRLQGKEQFHSKNYLLEMSRFHTKMRLKSAPQKLNFLMAKAISKSCTLDCSCKYPCMFPHSYAQ